MVCVGHSQQIFFFFLWKWGFTEHDGTLSNEEKDDLF